MIYEIVVVVRWVSAWVESRDNLARFLIRAYETGGKVPIGRPKGSRDGAGRSRRSAVEGMSRRRTADQSDQRKVSTRPFWKIATGKI
ncbi:MAG: hypothetical protein CL912_12960 [Deltaproteobacteria bacterium]|nr:hypothetical protein [Deltaproteobacteria bacterium]